MGVIARNMTVWNRDAFNEEIASYIKSFSLMVILVRGALELQFKGRLIGVILLTFIPFLTELIFDFFVIKFGFKIPTAISFAYAVCVTAVAPAVVVPMMLLYIKEGYGAKKGIPLKIIASSTFENIIILVIFGIVSVIGINQIATNKQNPGKVFGWSIL